jgi:hypothetical protein
MTLKKVFVLAILGISVFGLALRDAALGDCFRYTGFPVSCGSPAGIHSCSGDPGGPIGANCGVFLQTFGVINFPETEAATMEWPGYELEFTIEHLCGVIGDCEYQEDLRTGAISCQPDMASMLLLKSTEYVLNINLPCPK